MAGVYNKINKKSLKILTKNWEFLYPNNPEYVQYLIYNYVSKHFF